MEYSDSSVTVIMCTFNGEKFLEEQLGSFVAQTHTNWNLYVSDDGSTDATLEILRRFGTRVRNSNEVNYSDGPRKGFAANFLTAICSAPVSDFCAISDQDDIWQPRKLERALDCLTRVPPARPALYAARTRIADVSGREIRLSPLFKRQPSFANAVVQNIGGGNTMVMNRAAHQLARKAGPMDIVVHDWWLYQLVSGAGGEVIYDHEPHTLYRQHGSNLIGENTSLKARASRLARLTDGLFKSWMDTNLLALDRVRHLLTADNRRLLDDLIALRMQPTWHRVTGLRKLGVQRQTVAGNISLVVAAALGKL